MFKNIVLHWTAGNYKPCLDDIEHYHYLVDKDGNIINGKYEPQANLNCIRGKYAAHTGGGNTGRIGIAICCMRDKNTLPVQKQVESMCNFTAKLCHIYGLKPTDCITHAEFGIKHTKTSSYGKIDINCLPYANIKGVEITANYLRNKIQWYYNKIKGM